MENVYKILETIYSTLDHAASLSSAEKIRRVLRTSYNIKLSLAKVQAWLTNKRSYSLHKRALRHFERNPTIVSNLDDQWQIDLLFLPELKGSRRIALLAIDLTSRYVWVEPIRDKSALVVTAAMRKILLDAALRRPIKIHADQGTEFFNRKFQALMAEYGIELFWTKSDVKAAVAERAIRTIKEKIYRALDNDTKLGNRWTKIVVPIVKSYNKTFHKTIQTSPAEVNHKTVGDVLSSLYGKYWKIDRLYKKPKFAIGDYVRISIMRQQFMKGYRGKWLEEMFQVYQVKYTLPNNMYKIQSWDGTEKLEGTFYEQELQKVQYKPDTEFQIERVLKERVREGKKEFYVSWAGYSEEHNSWVREEDMVDL